MLIARANINITFAIIKGLHGQSEDIFHVHVYFWTAEHTFYTMTEHEVRITKSQRGVTVATNTYNILLKLTLNSDLVTSH